MNYYYEMKKDILTLPELARYLKVSKKTITRLMQKGVIRGFKVGNQWRFLKSMVDEWIIQNVFTIPEDSISSVIKETDEKFSLSNMLVPEGIVLDIIPGPKRKVISQAVREFYKNNLIVKPNYYIEKLLYRERIISTATNRGTAFPHLRNPQENLIVRPFIGIGICKEGTKFGAYDGSLTYVFVFVFIRQDILHLRLLARLSWLFKRKNVLDNLLKFSDKKEIIDFIISQDSKNKVLDIIRKE